jgi:hypothetical protein
MMLVFAAVLPKSDRLMISIESYPEGRLRLTGEGVASVVKDPETIE